LYRRKYDLTQASTANLDGSWNVSGTAAWSYYYGEDGACSQPLSGILDVNGNLEVLVDAVTGCGAYGDAFKILNSGCDLTTPDYFYEDGWVGKTWPPPSDFLTDLGYGTGGIVLIKAAADLPDTESSNIDSWLPSDNPSYGTGHTIAGWRQSLSLASSTDIKFGGRLVFEQNHEGVIDDCHFTGSAVPEAVGLSGGAWWVDGGNHWGLDGNGLQSNSVDYYRAQVILPCGIVLPQNMYVDSSEVGATIYTTNFLSYTIDADEVCSIREKAGETLEPV